MNTLKRCKLTSSLIDTRRTERLCNKKKCGIKSALPDRIHFRESCLHDMRNLRRDLYRFVVSAALSRLSASLHCWSGCLTLATADWYEWIPACCDAETLPFLATPCWFLGIFRFAFAAFLFFSLQRHTITCTCSKFNRSFFFVFYLWIASTFERMSRTERFSSHWRRMKQRRFESSWCVRNEIWFSVVCTHVQTDVILINYIIFWFVAISLSLCCC